MKELLVIILRKKKFLYLIFILELGILVFLNCINIKVGVELL